VKDGADNDALLQPESQFVLRLFVGAPAALSWLPWSLPVLLAADGTSAWAIPVGMLASATIVTLLEALRNHASFTGAKEVCDRATCGACTVLFGDKPVYACSMLALEAQGKPITTVEGLAENGKLTKVQEAFIDKDALMCGYCTPGFIMSITALLKTKSKPTADDVKQASQTLETQSQHLGNQVTEFLGKIRAA